MPKLMADGGPNPEGEWAYRHVFTSNSERAAPLHPLHPWLEGYACRRHSALGVLPPLRRL